MTERRRNRFNNNLLASDNILLLGVFFADATVTGVVAWLLVCATKHHAHGFLEAGLAWLWSFIAIVAGAGVVLGFWGGFSATGFLAFHCAMLAALAVARRHLIARDLAALRFVIRETREFFNTPGGNRMLGLGLLAILAGLTGIAALAQPAAMDALTYHLPRIGHWLQDGKIHFLETSDARLNFVADLPDIVMAWLVGSVHEGFRVVIVAQALGGIMAVGATIGLARLSGLSKGASILAGGLLLGMANVVAQFTTAQTDLFTTGVFATAFYLWLVALRRGEVSVLGVAGAGLALGAKGTLFYMVPSALLWVAWFAWHHRISHLKWLRTLGIAALGIGLFAIPGFLRNWQAYGGALGPAVWVKKHHQGFDSVSGQTQKIYLNLVSSLTQNFEPQSQPDGLRTISRAAGTILLNQLPEQDSYTLPGFNRKEMLNRLLHLSEPDADVSPFGLVTLLLFLSGGIISLIHWQRGKENTILLWSAGVIIFLLFFHGMQQWHPYAFRYFVIVGPWVAIVAAWGIEQSGQTWRNVLWVMAIGSALNVGWRVTTHLPQGGWKTVARPERSMEYFVSNGWREWSQQLDHVETPYRLALPEERPIAAFYRQLPRREVVFESDLGNTAITAEEFVRGNPGWVIVPAGRFLGREGHVAAKVWLFEGDEKSIFSLAAYRSLEATEKMPSIIYREKRVMEKNFPTYEFLLRPQEGKKFSLLLTNPGKNAANYEWFTPQGRDKGVLPAGRKITIEIPLPQNVVAEAKVAFSAVEENAMQSTVPSAEVVQ